MGDLVGAFVGAEVDPNMKLGIGLAVDFGRVVGYEVGSVVIMILGSAEGSYVGDFFEVIDFFDGLKVVFKIKLGTGRRLGRKLGIYVENGSSVGSVVGSIVE